MEPQKSKSTNAMPEVKVTTVEDIAAPPQQPSNNSSIGYRRSSKPDKIYTSTGKPAKIDSHFIPMRFNAVNEPLVPGPYFLEELIEAEAKPAKDSSQGKFHITNYFSRTKPVRHERVTSATQLVVKQNLSRPQSSHGKSEAKTLHKKSSSGVFRIHKESSAFLFVEDKKSLPHESPSVVSESLVGNHIGKTESMANQLKSILYKANLKELMPDKNYFSKFKQKFSSKRDHWATTVNSTLETEAPKKLEIDNGWFYDQLLCQRNSLDSVSHKPANQTRMFEHFEANHDRQQQPKTLAKSKHKTNSMASRIYNQEVTDKRAIQAEIEKKRIQPDKPSKSFASSTPTNKDPSSKQQQTKKNLTKFNLKAGSFKSNGPPSEKNAPPNLSELNKTPIKSCSLASPSLQTLQLQLLGGLPRSRQQTAPAADAPAPRRKASRLSPPHHRALDQEHHQAQSH